MITRQPLLAPIPVVTFLTPAPIPVVTFLTPLAILGKIGATQSATKTADTHCGLWPRPPLPSRGGRPRLLGPQGPNPQEPPNSLLAALAYTADTGKPGTCCSALHCSDNSKGGPRVSTLLASVCAAFGLRGLMRNQPQQFHFLVCVFLCRRVRLPTSCAAVWNTD